MNYFLFSTNLRPAALIEARDLDAANAAAAALALDGERVRVSHRIVPAVMTVADAWELFYAEMEEEDYKDNYRAAFADDAAAMAEYDDTAADGCCGSADLAYLVAGRLLYIGCNYGH